MQIAEEKTVLGNFANARLTYAGTTSTFFRRDGKYVVRTDGADGKLAEFEIKYTFGVRPLQQYLIEFPTGRIQALSIAWDSRPRENGGQRWFHLYPGQNIKAGDSLHWTGPSQNWNYMCADCHSTNLQKGYDAQADAFKTTWSGINVGCEACHGPGSNHVSWANARRDYKATVDDVGIGLTAQLDERRDVSWTLDAASGNSARSKPRTTEHEIEVCAQCHARRGQLADGYIAGKPFLDYYRPAFLTSPLYHADGQQHGEVYEWGSFLQSKMYAAGVTCSDCHDPHSGSLRADGNALCGQCHAAARFDTTAHHRHAPGSAGAQCANCHMPTATYMEIDSRRDHSIRVPRPDLSVQLGTPNACNACHSNRDAGWATDHVRAWFGHDPRGHQRFATAFADANAGAIGSLAQLRAVAADATQPAIARATAMAGINANANSATLDVAASALRDPSALVRLGALDALAGTPAELRLRYATPLLSDPTRVVRIEAASALADVPLSNEQRDAFERAAAEYVSSLRYNGDRADARANLGSFEARRGDVGSGEGDLKAAIAVDPLFVPAYINLADLYRAQGREAEVEHVLHDGLRRSPESAALHHALGLSLVRAKRKDRALSEFSQAARLEPQNARFAYVYGVALYSAGRVDEAIATLAKASASHPSDTDVLGALASFYRDRGDEGNAQRYVEKLRAVVAAQQ